MTQPATAPATLPVITGAPIIQQSASDHGEPTIEELAALVPAPTADGAEPAASPTDAATEPAEPAEGEPKPTEAPPVVEPDASEVDAAAERAAKAAAKAREGSRRYAATQEQLRQQAAQVQRAAYEAQQLRRENAAALEREAILKKDPYKALKDLGMTDADLAARAMRENTPEAAMARLQEQVEAERTARLSLEQRLVNERRAAQMAQAEAQFTQVADDEASYPRLSQLRSQAQLTVMKAALAQITENGHSIGHLTNAQVAEACELYLTPKKGAKPAAAPAAPVVAKPKPSGKTLTNAQAQTRVVAPAAWDSLSEEQQLAHIAASLPDPT